MILSKLRKALVFPTIFFSCFLANSQNRIPLKNNSFLGALEFLPNGTIANGYNRINYPSLSKTDPLLESSYRFQYGEEGVSGFMKDAVLFFEWWTKQGSPSERYKFEWSNTGRFYLRLKDGSSYSVDRKSLLQYPNLLQRFDNLVPIKLEFEVSFRSAGATDKDYYAFRNKHNILTDLGSAGFSVLYTRKIDGGIVLYTGSKESMSWSSPGLLSEGWNGFLNFDESMKKKRSELIELFKLGNEIVISSFRISKLEWRLSDFLFIATTLKDYESGKAKPPIEDEISKQPIPNKAGNEFWDDTEQLDTDTEPFYDEKLNRYGLRTKQGRILVQPKYNKLITGRNGINYIAEQNNTVFLLNKAGSIIKTKNYPSIPYNQNVFISDDLHVVYHEKEIEVEEYGMKIILYQEENLLNDSSVKKYFKFVNKSWDILVKDNNDTRTYSEIEAAEKRYQEKKSNYLNQLSIQYSSMGYEKKN